MTSKMMTMMSAATAVASAFALDFTWLTTAGSGNYWNNTSVWRVDGAVPERTPDRAEDSAYISYGGNSLARSAYVINFPSSGYYASAPVHELEFGSLACDDGLHPLLTLYTVSDGYSGFGQTITVSDPNGFGGFWTSTAGRGKLVLEAASLHSPFVKYFDTWGYMAIDVPEPGIAAEVGSLVRSGALRKMGTGKLTVDNAAGADSRIYVDDGTLVLKGVDEAALEPALPDGSVLHLDATKISGTDTREETYGPGNKRTAVTAWRDCDGNNVYCYVPSSPRTGDGYVGSARAPYLASVTSTTGLPLLDFGLPATCATEDSPSNCFFQVSTTIMAKEIFYVAQNTVPVGDAAESSGSLLGGIWGPDVYLQGGGRTAVFGWYCSDAAMRADITVNGCPGSNRKIFPTRFNGEDLGSLSVVSVKLSSAQEFKTIASEREMVNGTGGWRVGEILVYNRDLTDDERAEAVRFLMKKWHRDYVDKDVGELVVHADTATVEVPAGRVARVGSLSAHGCGKIVKDGAGTLLVDGIAQTNLVVEVRGGKVERVGSAIATNAPAASPMLWLDATATSSFVCDGGGSDTSKIVRWNDRRGASDYYAEIPAVDAGTLYHTSARTAGHFPSLIAGQTPTDLDSVSFGYVNKGNASWMWLQPRDQVDSYAAFVVYRVNTNPNDHNYCLGSSNAELVHGSGQFLGLAYAHPNSRMARWALDGRVLDPWFADFDGSFNTLDWRVQSYSGSLGKIRGDLLANLALDNPNDPYSGNIDLAEVILYDRPLTLDEVRKTEAYLMAKWLGKPHPEAESQVDEYRFADDVEASVGNPVAGTTNVIPRVSGSNGSMSAAGAGAVVVSETDGAVATNDVTVAGGALAITYPHGEIEVDDAGCALHFDASDLSSFTFDIVNNGDGSATTNVLVWDSQNSANLWFKSDKYVNRARSEAHVQAHPTFAAAAMPNGRVVSVVDFGSRNAADAAAMTIYIGPQPDQFASLKEIFVVCADQRALGADGADDYGDFVSSSYDYHFLRTGGCGLLNRNAADLASNKDMISVDGVAKANTDVLPKGFHVLSYRPVVSGVFGCLCADRASSAGGGKVAEILAFNDVLSDERREGIIAALKEKWLQRADPSTAVRSITLNGGAAFDAGSDMKVVAGAIAVDGAASLTCASLEVVDAGSLAVGVSEGGAVSSLAVSGAVDFGGAVTVSFALDDVRALQLGVYTLVSASTLGDVDFTGWTVGDGALLARRNVRFFRDGNNVKVEVSRKGLAIIVQ
ncbi:MAG: hypothetical protein IKF72_15045 [Kiritimatiellae bacterium]|nr:hypothetical protein [Kiritimatiellia bacterium]